MIELKPQGSVIPRKPVSELRVYAGVPWDNTYKHVRLYSSKQDLLNNLDKYRVNLSDRLDELAPIRVGSLYVSVPFEEMKALNLNYLAFRNTGISDEWVFCFITSVDWRSEKTTNISFELDIFQNNFYDVKIKPCFVEYHHIKRSDDVVGGNLIPVSIETGEPVVADFTAYRLQKWHLCMYVTEGITGEDFDGAIVNNIYRASGLWHMPISDKDTVPQINELIKTYTDAGKIDSILALFMSPELCVNSVVESASNEDDKKIYITDNFFEGYKPKNKKLYSYPWAYVLADNNEGQTNIYKFELSDETDHKLWFKIQGCLNTLPQAITFPFQYKGNGLNYADAMINSAFPQCAFNSDTFRAWVAQNKSTLGLSAMSSALSLASGAGQAVAGFATAGATGGIGIETGTKGVGSFTSALQQTLGLIGEVTDKHRQPATAHGKVLSENINSAFNITGICFYTMTCKKEFAKIADDFFECYGYPINRITIPLIHSRQSWNYVKTQGCGFSGRVDLDQLGKLREIFDRGVTLWHTDDIGNYNLQNN